MGFLNKKPIKLPTNERGVALLEFTVSMPLLILLVAILGEVGNLLYTQTSLNKSLENGAMYASKNTRMGTGLIKIEAQTLKNTQNLVIYGNIAGSGPKTVKNLKADDISLDCTFGTDHGFCETENYISAVTLKASVEYIPLLGTLLDAVTGFSMFPLTLTATTTVVPV